MLAGVGAQVCAPPLRQRQTARGSVLTARAWDGGTVCAVSCFCWQPNALVCVDKQQFEQASGGPGSRNKSEAAGRAVLRPAGAGQGGSAG